MPSLKAEASVSGHYLGRAFRHDVTLSRLNSPLEQALWERHGLARRGYWSTAMWASVP